MDREWLNMMERKADDFDLSLFRLIRQADELAVLSPRGEDKVWSQISHELRSTRPRVRALMSPSRRADTE